MSVKRLAAMSAAFAVSDAVRAGLGLATSVLLARTLGLDGFGRLTLCLAWTSTFIVLFDLGCGVLLAREAARDAADHADTLSAAIALRLALFAPVGVFVAAAAEALTVDPQTAAGLRLGAINAAAALAYGGFASTFRGRDEWLRRGLAIDVGGTALQATVAVWAMRQSAGLVQVLVLFAAIQVVQLAIAALMWRRTAARSGPLRWPTIGTIRRVLHVAWPFAAAGLVANAQTRVAPLLLGALSTPSDVAVFGIASRIATLVRAIPHAVFAGALPVFASGVDTAAVRARLDRTILGFGVAAGIGMAAAGPPIVTLLYGDEFTAAWPLIWTAAWLVPALVNAARRVYLIGRSREREAVAWHAVALAVQSVLCIAGARLYGAAGAAAALALGEAAVWAPLARAAQSAAANVLVNPQESGGRPVGVVGGGPLMGGRSETVAS